MFLYEFEGKRPAIADDAFVAPTATLIGDVTIESGASVWYGAVLRGDEGPIVVRRDANVQDFSLLHCPPGVTTEVGPGATVAHQCVVHGAVVEEEALVAQRLRRARRSPHRISIAGRCAVCSSPPAQ